MRYDISAGEYVYRSNDANAFDVEIAGRGVVTWAANCHVLAICLKTGEGIEWLPAAEQGTAEGEAIVFWGECQVPGLAPPRAYLPLVVKGG